MKLDEKEIQPNPTSIYVFEGTKAQPIGDVTLPVIAACKTLFVTFVVVDRLVNKMFKNQIDKTIEVYIDDMIVKNQEKSQHVRHLEEVFNILRRYCMRLNPKKCAFGVLSGQFLGQIVNKRGIEPSPSKVEALWNIPDLRTPRDVQVRTGRIVAFSRFFSRSSDRCKPFFHAIRNKDGNI
ncbi:unnamed protein product [Prunus brigantina]